MSKRVSKLVIFMVMVSMLLCGCKGEKQEVTQPELIQPINASDKLEKIVYREIYNVNSYEARVTPYTEDLSFNVDGTFEEYNVIIGEKVKKGQKLASLSNEQFKEELEQLQNEYKETRIKYDNEKEKNELAIKIIDAKLEMENDKLKNSEADEKEEIQYNLDKLKLDKKNIQDSAKIKYLDYKDILSDYNTKMDICSKKTSDNDIVAPFDGVVISTSNIEKGSFVSSNLPIVQIVDTTQCFISSDLSMIYMINDADQYYALFHGKRYELEYTGKKQNGLFSASDKSLQENCKFTFKNKDDKIDFGESGLLCLLFNYKEKALSVSNKALYSEGMEKNYVYRIKDGKKEKVYVELGTKTDIYTEIISGLEEGDEVVDE